MTTTIDRSELEQTLYRAAISAITYYPNKMDDEPGYMIDEDVDWCLIPLGNLDGGVQEKLRHAIRAVIANPSANRQDFVTILNAIGDGSPEWMPRLPGGSW